MNWLLVLQIIISLALITIVMLQPPSSSIGSTFGGNSARYHTKKGAEKFIFMVTIALSALFIAVSLVNIIL